MKKQKVFIIAGIVTLVIAAALFFFLSQGFIPSIKDKDAIEEALNEEGKHYEIIREFRMQVDPNDLSVYEAVDDKWMHILLLGTDTWDASLNNGRSDAMIVASVHMDTKEVKVTSLVRDMLVDIPGLKSQQRINTANAFGGPLLAIKTVNELLALNITRYASINFGGFTNVIDKVEGLEIELDRAEAKLLRVEKTEGPQLLEGWQVLEFSRIRKLDNNFGRNERQRKVLAALFEKMKDLGLKESIAVLPQLLRFVSTNLSTSEILALMPAIFGNTQGIDMLSLPPDKTFHYDRYNDESVIAFNLEKTRAAFNEFINGVTSESHEKIN